MAVVSITDYLTALDSTAVSDLEPQVKIDLINLARNEIIDAYPWPFRENRFEESNGFRLPDPATTPTTASGSELVKLKYAVNDNGMRLQPVSDLQMADLGAFFSPDTGVTWETGDPAYVCVYTFLSDDNSQPIPPRETFFIPFPYGPITVVPLISAVALDETYNPYENLIPPSFKMAVVYGAAVHAHSMVGTTDLAETYRERYASAIEALRNNQFGKSFLPPTIEYPQGI